MRARALAVCLIASPAYALDAQPAPTSTWVSSTVSLEIREPDGTSKKISGIPWSLHLTALDAMKMADGLKFTAEWYKNLGQWEIDSIDGTLNEGSKNQKRNWLFCVDGYAAGVGADSYVLGSTSAVVWFYSADYPPKCP